MKITYGKERKAISPVIATVILIAITLIAAIAIAGFVFGLFGSFTSSAQVTATASLVASATSGALTTPSGLSCATTTPASGSYVTAINSGTGSVSVTGVSITSGGSTVSATVATCSVGASGSGTATQYLALTVGTTPAKGTQFTGSLSLSNGATVPFSGVFQ